MRVLFACLMLAVSLGASAQAYRWVDENGVVHYSDIPHPGAERIELRSAQGFTPPTSARAPAAETGGTEAAAVGYERFEVVSPTNDQTLWNIETQMDVQIAVVPRLGNDHSITLEVDGQRVSEEGNRATQFTVGGVYRGTHNIQASIVDASGRVIQRAEPVTVHVHQTAQQNRPVNLPSRPGPGG